MSNTTKLNEEIDQLSARLSTVKPFGLQQLKQWRDEAHVLVDEFYRLKRDTLIGKRRDSIKDELEHLKAKLARAHGKHDLETVEHELEIVDVKVNELEHLRLTIRPMKFDDRLIIQRNLFPLSHPHRTIHLKTGNECPIGSNDQHLLVDREGKHLTLLDHHLNIVGETNFNHDGIHGICWSKTLSRFIIILFREIYLLNEKTMKTEKCSIAHDVDWWRGTCSDDKLFLSTVEWGSSVYEFDLHSSSFQRLKVWHSPTTCGKDEIICDLKYSNNHLAIPISHKNRSESRFELRLASTFECLWSVNIHGRVRCCSINGDQWLAMDQDDFRFFHISADGGILKTDRYEHHEPLEDLIPWGENQLAVLTKNSVNLHELS